MKKLLALTLCLLLLCGCAATYDGPTESKYVLTEYTVTHYPFGWDNMKYTDRDVYAYDIYGNRVREMSYRDGELQQVCNRKHDDRGNCIREVYWDHSGWFILFDSRVEKTFDEQNRQLSYVCYDFFGSQQSGSWYTYDDEARTRTWTGDGGSTQTAWLDENGNEIREVSGEYETIYEYDENGFLTGWASYKNGELYDRYESAFDEKGRQLYGRRYNAQGELESETVWEYDDEAHTATSRRPDGQIRTRYFDADGRVYMIEDYNSDGTRSMLQQYYYQQIRVPAEGDDTP